MSPRILAFAALTTLVACSRAPLVHPIPPVTTALPTTATGLPLSAPQLRLPTTLRPRSYAITMRMSPTAPRIEGKVDVEVDLTEPSKVLWIHAGENLTVHAVSASSRPGRADRADESLVALSFDDALPAGHHTLSIAYEGTLPPKAEGGAYRQEERGDWYIYTQFEATDARRAFPCFDEPGFKTPFKLTLEVPKDQLAFANTPEESSKPNGDWKTVSFAATQPLPTYLVAFAVGPFEIVDGGKAGAKKTPVRIIVPKGRSADAKYAAEQTGQVLERLEKYFDIPYPYEKLDHIAVPQKGGAMENPGLITYGSNTILRKPSEHNTWFERDYLGIASHELGHIWFGDYVTTAWWDDIWLNEAFATWISAKIVEAWHPEWDGSVSRMRQKENGMSTDALLSARRIRQPIESKHDIANAFDSITYQKGGSVIAMFESYVGEQSFRSAVHDYLQRHAFGNATANDFLSDVAQSLAKSADPARAASFQAAFATFLDQPGIPLVSAELACPKDAPPKLLLAQQRYRPAGSAPGADQTWSVPVCASFAGGKSCLLMTGPSAELPLTNAKACPKWVNANAGGTGYYRVEYKGDLLARLLENWTLPIHERFAILSDAIALVRSGRVKESEVLGLVPAIVQEGNRHLVGTTVGLVSGMPEYIDSDDVRAKYTRFVKKTYLPRAAKLGWKQKATDDETTRVLRRSLLWLTTYAQRDEQDPLAAEARKLTEAWLADRKAVDDENVGTVLTAGLRGADRAHWEKLHTAAKAADDRRDRERILSAMATTTDPKLVDANLGLVLSGEFDVRETLTLLYGAANEPRTRQTAWDFAKTHYDQLVASLPKRSGGQLVGVGARFCDAEHRSDLQSFFADRIATVNGGPRALAQALELMSLCIAQRDTRKASVAAFLAGY